ncbi:MAG TPA: DUF167 domain-containing protein [Spirochaetota bacterium]|jgi:hypothetical protein|nr:DUF167 domain-containing protein [Spirochaetota bacterium]OQA98263.1 MAG: hypothetical protein BWY23_01196 [Spirochaetes bacterium ADurb.Bin218]HOK03161.1 DUF167 domain-containing protein [Spirochaetota bacterium]HOK93393.1 DUF167 domain-containing protein [Spirochaetota bacterium]HON16940.1 DUF167 domain-containing protein [Spirochaetota bacterium]
MEKKAIIDISVLPKSSRSDIVVDSNCAIKVYLNSPPVDGKANKECIELFAKKLKISKSLIEIDKGEHGRKKRIVIHGLELSEVMLRLKEK